MLLMTANFSALSSFFKLISTVDLIDRTVVCRIFCK